MVTHTGAGDRQGHKDDIFHARRVPPVPWQSLHTGCDSAFFPSSAEDSKESPSATHGAAGICSSLPPSFSAPHPSPLTQLQPLAALPGASAGLWELREQQSPESLWPLLGAGCAGDRHSHGHSWWGTKPVSQPQLVLPAWQGMSSLHRARNTLHNPYQGTWLPGQDGTAGHRHVPLPIPAPCGASEPGGRGAGVQEGLRAPGMQHQPSAPQRPGCHPPTAPPGSSDTVLGAG